MKLRGSWRNATRCSLLASPLGLRNSFLGYPPWTGDTGAILRRGAKRKSILKVDQLPQGHLPALSDVVGGHGSGRTYPPTMQQHLDNMRKYPDCVVLTRVGDFYELYFDQVEEYAPLLNIKKAKKWTSAGNVAMAGFQYNSLDRFLKVLVLDLGKKVAISEQNRLSEEERNGSSNMYDRRVTRIVTAGTLVDESFVDPYDNNHLLAVHISPEVVPALKAAQEADTPVSLRSTAQVGLSWVDLSSGEFNIQTGELSMLQSMIARVGPREVVLDSVLKDVGIDVMQHLLGDGSFSVRFHQRSSRVGNVESWESALERPMTLEAKEALTEYEVEAGSFVLDYIQDLLLDNKILLQPPTLRSNDEYMVIDKQSLRGLEIRSTIRDGFMQGSLLHTVRHTVTKGGARLLARRLVSPSMSLSIINDRLDLVEELKLHDSLRDDLRALLTRTSDIARLLQRFSIGKGDADDLLGLAETTNIMTQISATLDDHVVKQLDGTSSRCLKNIADSLELEGPTKVARAVLDAIDEDCLARRNAAELEQQASAEDMTEEVAVAEAQGEQPPRLSRRVARSKPNSPLTSGADDMWIIRNTASPKLAENHKRLLALLAEARDLEARLQVLFNSPSLALRWSSQHGFHGSMKPSKTADLSPLPDARVLAAKKTSTILSLPEWNELGTRIDASKLRIREEEERVFGTLRARVIENMMKLRRNASLLDQLDVACSSAKLANEHNLARPLLNDGMRHNIIGGRHPTVDVALVTQQIRPFVANNCMVGDQSPIYFITGPNMGGKSTYLRQNALITILAQSGLFVPASHAEIGLVDKIFSRVGSADNLYRDQSTFMVEMLETAEILKQATPRSFVVMDEIGRGTTPEAGIAVGYACLHHLHHINQCRTLFATHFHALADMTKEFGSVAYFCTDVSVNAKDGTWMYEHRLREGVNRDSHALKVAKIAGVPESAIEVAARVLQSLQDDKRRVLHDVERQKATA